jgi:NAD(P)-dependent dehydrogenase (short-subunit alcohol dehydrogenase family)
MRKMLAEERGLPYDEALERVMVDEWGLDVALGRPGRPEEVGELIAFLLSPRAGYLTGALINIDGGTNF